MYKNFTEFIDGRPRSSIYKAVLFIKIPLFLIGATLPPVYASANVHHAVISRISQAISGKVTDDKGLPLAGVNIKEKGKQNFVTTDVNGDFKINVEGENAILAFSYIGFTTQEVLVGVRKQINIILSENSKNLNEVVVIGYGAQKRGDVNGSIASVTAKDIQDIPQTSVDQMLQGKAAGVTVTNGSGAPGSSASVHIRGVTSLSGSNEPLYVVDGVFIDGAQRSIGININNGENNISPLSYLNPNDIASIDILKDASATAIYGSRASNGVVIITTKRGKSGDARLSYDGYYGFQQQGHFLDMMNLQQYASLQNTIGILTGVGIRSEFVDPSLLGPGTDWQKAVFRTAPMQNHNLSISGGTDKMNYYISGGYLKQDGTIIGSDFKRYSFRSTAEGKVRDWFTLGSNMTLNRTEQNIGASDNGGIVYSALLNAPDQAASNPDGSYTVPAASYGVAFISPVALALLNTNKVIRNDVNANFYSDIHFIKDLTLRSEIGGYYSFGKSLQFAPAFTVTPPNNPTTKYGNNIATLSEYADQYIGWTWKEYFTYNHTFAKKNNITATVGYELNEDTGNSTSAGTNTFLTNDLPTLGLGGAKVPTIGESKSSHVIQSFYARAIYGYDNKYSLTATIRSDKSSNFDEGHKVGYFPSAAFGWTISNEPFMAGVKKFADNIKFRVGYGEVGNQNIGGYQYGAALTPSITGLGTGFNVDKYQSPNITWQTSKQTDIGLDFTLFNRIDAAIDWYSKTSAKFLFRAPLPEFLTGTPTYLGGLNSPYRNGGEVSNKGIEFSLNTRNIIAKDFKWSTSITFTHYTNKVVSTFNNAEINATITSGFLQIPVTKTKVGGAIGEFYGYTVKGIFKTADQLKNAPVQFGLPISNTPGTPGSTSLGDIQFEDINHDGKIDPNDMSSIGNPNPTFTYGFTNNFSYKDFELSVFLYGSYGGKILNFLNYNLEGLNSLYANQLAEAANFWSPTNPNSDIPAPKGGVNNNLNMSTRFLQSASFLRFQNVRLGYNLPQKYAKHIALSNLKVYCSAQNLFVITGYKGLDPEVGQQNQNVFLTNVDFGRYPSPRVITFGINAQF